MIGTRELLLAGSLPEISDGNAVPMNTNCWEIHVVRFA
jgi:hypothetical protein